MKYRSNNPILKVKFLLLLLIFLNSCTVNKKVQKDKTSTQEVTKSQENASLTNTTVSIKETIETFTAPIIVPSDSLKGEVSIKDLIKRGEFELKDEDSEVTLVHDPATGVINIKSKTKEKKISAPGTRVIKEQSTSTTQAQSSKKVDTKKETNEKKVTKNKKIEGINLNYIWLILLLLGFFAIWWIVPRKST